MKMPIRNFTRDFSWISHSVVLAYGTKATMFIDNVRIYAKYRQIAFRSARCAVVGSFLGTSTSSQTKVIRM